MPAIISGKISASKPLALRAMKVPVASILAFIRRSYRRSVKLRPHSLTNKKKLTLTLSFRNLRKLNDKDAVSTKSTEIGLIRPKCSK